MDWQPSPAQISVEFWHFWQLKLLWFSRERTHPCVAPVWMRPVKLSLDPSPVPSCLQPRICPGKSTHECLIYSLYITLGWPECGFVWMGTFLLLWLYSYFVPWLGFCKEITLSSLDILNTVFKKRYSIKGRMKGSSKHLGSHGQLQPLYWWPGFIPLVLQSKKKL